MAIALPPFAEGKGVAGIIHRILAVNADRDLQVKLKIHGIADQVC